MKQKPCNYFAYIYLYFRIIRKKKTSTQLKNKRKLNKKTFFSFTAILQHVTWIYAVNVLA